MLSCRADGGELLVICQESQDGKELGYILIPDINCDKQRTPFTGNNIMERHRDVSRFRNNLNGYNGTWRLRNF